MHFSMANQPQLKVTKNWLRIQKEFKSDVAKKFAEFEIVPDVIVTAPDELCSVTFPGGVSVKMGDKLSSEQIKEEPEVLWNCDKDAVYTLVMQNVDDHDCMDTRSWVVVNCPGCNYFEGHNLFDYKEQDPDKHQDRYRIVFLIYRQPEDMDIRDISYYDFTSEAIYPDPSFDVQHFADFHGLGDPVAGNFFIMEDVKFKNRIQALYKYTPRELRYPKLLWAWEEKVKREALEKARKENLTRSSTTQSH